MNERTLHKLKDGHTVISDTNTLQPSRVQSEEAEAKPILKQHELPKPFDFTPYQEAAKQITLDPLSDERYLKAHRRSEVAEKRLRNIERERVQHDRAKFEQYLDKLNSSEWLKVLGAERLRLSDEEKQRLETKRQALIIEIKLILEKFRAWKDEEKRRKSDKDGISRDTQEGRLESRAQTMEKERSQDVEDDESSLESSSTRKRQKIKKPITLSEGDTMTHITACVVKITSPTPPPPKPYTSFYEKDYTRTAALNTSRRISRNTLAFGLPVPDFEEQNFYLDDRIIKEQEAKGLRKRLKR